MGQRLLTTVSVINGSYVDKCHLYRLFEVHCFACGIDVSVVLRQIPDLARSTQVVER